MNMTALMKTYSIALLPGDGTGPEVSREAVKVVNAAAAKFGFKLDYTEYDFGGDRYLRTGETLPDSAIEEFRKHQSIYLGAIGHPDVKPGILEVGILLRTRFELDQYINLRPVKLYRKEDCPLKDKEPKDVDFVVIRENTGGIYTGVGGAVQKGSNMEVATQVMVYSRPVVDRCLKYAYEYTRRRKRKNMLTLVHKCNVLTHCGDLWVRAHKEMGDRDYPDIKQDYNHVDAATMWFVKQPEWYDVVVTENLFGDIITDLAAIVQGGLGVAAGGNINPDGVSMFECMGGSAPKYTGKNIINPIAAIAAGGMMLDTLGETEAAQAVDRAVTAALTSAKIHSLPAGRRGMGPSEVGAPRRQPCVTAVFTTEYTEKHRAWIGLCDPLCPLWFKAKGDSK
jgi:3-isopropylmalate dehydrogenase